MQKQNRRFLYTCTVVTTLLVGCSVTSNPNVAGPEPRMAALLAAPPVLNYVDVLDAPDNGRGDIAIDDDRVVALGGGDFLGPDGILVFERNSLGDWSRSNIPADIFCPVSVAVDGDRIVVGSAPVYCESSGQHRVLVYDRDSNGVWVETHELLDPIPPGDFGADSGFGLTVAVEGNRILVGSNFRGAFLFEENVDGTWEETSFLPSDEVVPAGGRFNNDFGADASISGDRVIIGAPRDQFIDPQGIVELGGAAYIYELIDDGSWIEKKLVLSDRQSGQIGFSASIEGDRAIVDGVHSTYVYDRDAEGNWIETAMLTPTDTLFANFTLSGNRIIASGPSSLSANVFQQDEFTGNWMETILSASGELFGRRSDIHEDWAIVGGDFSSDSVYVYQIPDPEVPDVFCNGKLVTVNLSRGEIPSSNDDVILGTNGNDTIVAMGGDDTICGLEGDDIISGGRGNDWVDAGPGNDTVDGGSDNDEIYGDSGVDILNGGPNDDRIYGESDGDFIKGNSGDDYLDGGFGVDQILGGSGDDVINTGTGGNRGTGLLVTGGAGNDVITGGRGNDEIRGETGNDIIYGGDAGDDLYGGGGNDIVYGQNGNDLIRGNGSKDTLYGGDGNDEMDGGDSDDVMYGSNGDDVMYGTTGNDEMHGGAGEDEMYGGGGNDVMYGNRGDDELFGGGSNDTLNGGSDTDHCDGGSGTDSVVSCES